MFRHCASGSPKLTPLMRRPSCGHSKFIFFSIVNLWAEQWCLNIMRKAVLFHLLLTDIRVTVFAKMPAGIVFTDIHTGNTPAKFPLVLIFPDVQFLSGQF